MEVQCKSMSADAQATQGSRTSAVMIFVMYDKRTLVFHEEFHLPVTPHRRDMTEHVNHYSDVIISVMSQISCLSIVYSTVCSGADQRKHQSSALLAFVRGIHQSPVNSPHKFRVKTRKKFPFDDVIMYVLFVLFHKKTFSMSCVKHHDLKLSRVKAWLRLGVSCCQAVLIRLDNCDEIHH